MLLYLATPYSHPDRTVIEDRYQRACKAAAKLMEMGYDVFCPIAHSHPIAAHLDAERLMDHHFWLKQDFAVLKYCDAVVVCCMEGYKESRGVTAEVAHALANGITVYYVGENMIGLVKQMIEDDANQVREDDYSDFLDTEDASGDAVVAALFDA